MVTLCRHQQDSCWHLAATFGQRHADCVMLIYLQIFLLQGLTRKSHRLPSAPPLKEMGPTGLPPHATFTVIHDSRCKGYFFFQVFCAAQKYCSKIQFFESPPELSFSTAMLVLFFDSGMQSPLHRIRSKTNCPKLRCPSWLISGRESGVALMQHARSSIALFWDTRLCLAAILQHAIWLAEFFRGQCISVNGRPSARRRHQGDALKGPPG